MTTTKQSKNINEEKNCCPRFDPAHWDDKTFEWDNKKFIKDKVFTLFYMPMNFGGVMKRVYEKVEKVGATIQDGMWLSDLPKVCQEIWQELCRAFWTNKLDGTHMGFLKS